MTLYFFMEIMMVFMGVAFVVLTERKTLGLIQFRWGPNKVNIKGFIQSLSDFLKLLSKTMMSLYTIFKLEYNSMPLGMLFLMSTLWIMMPSSMSSYNNNLLMIICLFSLMVYPIMFGSWFSECVYSMYSSIRSIAQMVSYEVSMVMIIMGMAFLISSFNLMQFWGYKFSFMFLKTLLLVFMLFLSSLVELGRSPVDLLEGESELVSGFNTEYFGMKFGFIFLSEYGMIMFWMGFMTSMCFGLESFKFYWGLMTGALILLVLLVRGISPRIRYDYLMMACWIGMMGMSLGMLMMCMGWIVVFMCML